MSNPTAFLVGFMLIVPLLKAVMYNKIVISAALLLPCPLMPGIWESDDL
jgi:hypothetical protein